MISYFSMIHIRLPYLAGAIWIILPWRRHMKRYTVAVVTFIALVCSLAGA